MLVSALLMTIYFVKFACERFILLSFAHKELFLSSYVCGDTR